MEFASCGRIFNARGGKKEIFRKAVFIPLRRGRLIKIARRAPLPFIIFNL